MRPLLFILVMLLSACGSADKPAPSKPADTPRKQTVFAPLLRQRDRAQEMADKLPQERKETLDKAIDGDPQ